MTDTSSFSPAAWLDMASDGFDAAQDWLYADVAQPLIQLTGLHQYAEQGYVAAQWLLVGALEVLTILCLLMPLERLRPFERTAEAGSTGQAVWVDVIYTLIDRLGLLRLVLFLLLDPLWKTLFGWLAVQGFNGWQLDQMVAPWWPGVTDTALFGFALYVVVLDLAGYGVHRAQHRWDWWWALHAVHHSQRHMTAWTDSRTHLLDTLITDMLFVLLARVIGVPTDQFIGLVVLSKMMESLSHANFNLPFGWLGERLLVSPQFHRIHHGIYVDEGMTSENGARSCNFSVLFPVWDMLFGSARFGQAPGPTGIIDQLPGHTPDGRPRDYGQGFWAQQAKGLLRLGQALRT